MTTKTQTKKKIRESNISTLFTSLIESPNFSKIKNGKEVDVALINMPFYWHTWPSIQLGLLKSVLMENGYSVVDIYLNVLFANLIGVDLYKNIATTGISHVGEWIFSWASFGNNVSRSDDEYFKYHDKWLYLVKEVAGSKFKEILKELRYTKAPEFIKSCTDLIDWSRFRVVGFTCTFQQLVPSLALARSIKSKYPKITIVFGGAAVEGVMGKEIKDKHEFIDGVIDGEGEERFFYFLDSAGIGRTRKKYYLGHDNNIDLNKLPYPDYLSFYELRNVLKPTKDQTFADLTLPIEMSRGCWWSQKSQCSFCGLNGKNTVFRSKTPDRVIEELGELSSMYDGYLFRTVDNVIDHKYFKTLLPKMAEMKCDYNFFIEVRPNLKTKELRILKEAGCNRLQPGIESLSTHLLKLMNKGTTSADNVNVLKWIRYFGFDVSWNLLYGFPGETAQDYEDQTSLISSIVHLPPPQAIYPMRLDRYSPYFKQRGTLFRDVRYQKCYDYIYPDAINRWNIAYHYEGKCKNSVNDKTKKALRGEVEKWKKSWSNGTIPLLVFKKGLNCIHVIDKRNKNEPQSYKLTDISRQIFALTVKDPLSFESISSKLTDKYSKTEMYDTLSTLVKAKLFVCLDNRYINLVLPNNAMAF